MEKYKKVMALLTLKQADFLNKMSEEGYSKVEIIRRALDLFIEEKEKHAIHSKPEENKK